MFDASREIPTRTRQSEMRRLQIGPDSTAAAEESSHGGDVGLPDRGTIQPATSRLTRALRARDILSTFDRNEFPLHYISEAVCRRVALLEEPKAIVDCLEQGDLNLTMLRLAVNDSTQYEIFCQLLSEGRCAQFFEQKLRRRIEGQITAFDMVANVSTDATRAFEQDQLERQVDAIAFELNDIVEVARLDLKWRLQGERETAKHLVSMMREVCNRPKLFHTLIGYASSSGAQFGLEALRALSRETIAEQRSGLTEVRRLLVERDAPDQYLRSFDEIM